MTDRHTEHETNKDGTSYICALLDSMQRAINRDDLHKAASLGYMAMASLMNRIDRIMEDGSKRGD